MYLEIFPVLDFHYLCVASGVVSKEQLMLYTILYLEMFLLWIFTKLNESRAGVNRKLELWRRTLESKGFKLSRTKTKYMMCEFSATRHEGGDVSLDGKWWSRRIFFGI